MDNSAVVDNWAIPNGQWPGYVVVVLDDEEFEAGLEDDAAAGSLDSFLAIEPLSVEPLSLEPLSLDFALEPFVPLLCDRLSVR